MSEVFEQQCGKFRYMFYGNHLDDARNRMNCREEGLMADLETLATAEVEIIGPESHVHPLGKSVGTYCNTVGLKYQDMFWRIGEAMPSRSLWKREKDGSNNKSRENNP
jgi:hypothetical protein